MKILLFLLLMTGICFADEPEIIDYSDMFLFSTINNFPLMVKSTHRIEFYYKNESILIIKDMDENNYFNIDKSSVSLSCPDGYHLQEEIWNRNIKVYGSSARHTDADIKCVKEDE